MKSSRLIFFSVIPEKPKTVEQQPEIERNEDQIIGDAEKTLNCLLDNQDISSNNPDIARLSFSLEQYRELKNEYQNKVQSDEEKLNVRKSFDELIEIVEKNK